MKKWYWIGFLIVLVLWLAGSWWIVLPSTERALTEAATKALSDPANRQAFSDVKVSFSGQEAVLTGQVASEADKAAAGDLILSHVKLPGSSLNPVLGLRNAIAISTDYAAKHPRPWLMALVMPGSATITGVLPTAADRDAAAKALAAKLGPAGAKLDNQIKTAPEAGDVRAAVDLPGTLASNDLSSLPGKALAEEKFKAAIAVSACDGHWTLLPASTDDTGVVAALGNALPDPSLVNTAYAPLLAMKVEQNEKDRLSRLPPASIALLVVGEKLQPGGSVQVTGSVADQVSKNALMQALHKKYERYAVKDNTTLSGAVRPGGDWAKGLAVAPHPGKDLNAIKLDLPGTSHILVPGTDPTIFALGSPEGKPVVWDGKAASNEFAKALSDSDFGKALSAVGLTAPPVQPLFDAIEDLKRAKKAEAEARASAEAAAAAQRKAAADAAAKAKADAEAAMAKARTDAEAKAKAQQTKLPAPGYLGWAVTGTTVRLFGVAGSAEQKDTALKAAAAAFPGLTVDAAGIAIDAARVLPGVKFPAGLDPKKPGIGILSGGTESKTFDADAYDSEIVKAMPFAGFSPEDLAKSLEGYRADLVKAGTLKPDDAYVSISSDGKVVTLSGELADAAARSKVVEAVKAGAAGLTVDDKGLQVTPLVKADADLSATLGSLPKFEPGKAQIATLRPGQKTRAGVVHGIYFATGSDRSKDQERALYQVRRLLALNPAAKFEIVGSTDNVGSADANIKLSEERAQKFAAYLEAAGVPKDRLSTRGAGPNEPIADNATDSGRAMNRRVDVLLK